MIYIASRQAIIMILLLFASGCASKKVAETNASATCIRFYNPKEMNQILNAIPRFENSDLEIFDDDDDVKLLITYLHLTLSDPVQEAKKDYENSINSLLVIHTSMSGFAPSGRDNRTDTKLILSSYPVKDKGWRKIYNAINYDRIDPLGCRINLIAMDYAKKYNDTMIDMINLHGLSQSWKFEVGLYPNVLNDARW